MDTELSFRMILKYIVSQRGSSLLPAFRFLKPYENYHTVVEKLLLNLK